MSVSENSISVYYQNVRGLRTKSNNFYINTLANNFDIIMLTETWLTESIYSSELFTDHYNIFRKVRNYKRGGGALIAIRNDLVVTEIEMNNLNFEALAVKTLICSKIYYFVNVYFPPNSKLESYLLFLSQFRIFLKYVPVTL